MLWQKLLGAVPAPTDPVNISYIGRTIDTVNRTTYNFTSRNIGAASSDRVVLVGVHAYSNSNHSISSVSVGGVSATRLARSNGNNNYATAEYASIWAANVPTGTTATVQVAGSTTLSNCAIYIYVFMGTNYQAEALSPTYFDSTTQSSFSVSFPSVSAGNAVLLVSRIRSAQAGTWTILPLEENNDESVESAISGAVTGFANISSPSAPYQVTLATSSGNTPNAISPAMVRIFR
jgi:hypothetical protein